MSTHSPGRAGIPASAKGTVVLDVTDPDYLSRGLEVYADTVTILPPSAGADGLLSTAGRAGAPEQDGGPGRPIKIVARSLVCGAASGNCTLDASGGSLHLVGPGAGVNWRRRAQSAVKQRRSEERVPSRWPDERLLGSGATSAGLLCRQGRCPRCLAVDSPPWPDCCTLQAATGWTGSSRGSQNRRPRHPSAPQALPLAPRVHGLPSHVMGPGGCALGRVHSCARACPAVRADSQLQPHNIALSFDESRCPVQGRTQPLAAPPAPSRWLWAASRATSS